MIPVNEPVISGNSKKYVNEALDSGWVSSAGKFIGLFEESFSEYLGVKHAITTTNGTTALHLAVVSLGIGPGDEVIMPDLTIISCPFSVIYAGGTPVFVDVDPNTGNIDPEKIEEKITNKTKAIMPVHLYGHPADMEPILRIAGKYNLFVIEDAAEAHGAEYKGKKVGGIGDVGCFSFFANKIVTTGEGGMVVTNDDKLAQRARLYRDLSHSPKKRFLHEEIGFNFRMTNLQAALGFGELEKIDEYLAKKRWVAAEYGKNLSGVECLVLPKEEAWAKSVYWMYAITLNSKAKINRDSLRMKLKEKGVDTRDFFIPLHTQPVLKGMGLGIGSYPVSDKLSENGFYLPSGLVITKEQIHTVADCLKEILS